MPGRLNVPLRCLHVMASAAKLTLRIGDSEEELAAPLKTKEKW